MKALIVSKFYPPFIGGIETNTYQLAKLLHARGHSVGVLCSSAKGEQSGESTHEGIGVHRSWTPLKYESAPLSPLLFLEALTSDFDAALLHEPNPCTNVLVALACLLKRKPFFVTYHSDIYKPNFPASLLKSIYLSLFQSPLILSPAKKIFPTSQTYAEEVSDVLPRFKDKLMVCPNGVDLTRFCPNEKSRDLIARHNLAGKQTLLFVGRLIPYKGLDVLLEAFSSVSKQLPATTLLIVGGGPLEAQLKKKAQELGTESKTIFTGRVKEEELVDYYRLADLFILPSIYKTEAFGIALLEAMACGIPCIGTDISGTKFVLEGAGKIVKAGDSTALAKEITATLSSEPELKKMRFLSLARANELSWEKVLLPIAKEMEAVAGEGKAAGVGAGTEAKK